MNMTVHAMNMTVHPEPQGSDAWLAGRAERDNAGDAAAMLGCDPNGRTRTDLLDAMVKGFSPEVGAFKQRMFDKGHEVEALARPLAEGMVGEDLYPLVGSIRVYGLSRPLGASFDGLTMARDTNFECKSLNEALAAALPAEDDPDANDAAQLPKGYRVQMEQQLWVSGAERVLFCAAEFHADGSTKSLRACWYRPDLALRKEIMDGWRQLEVDRATHVPTIAAPVIAAEPVESFPAPVVQVSGQLTLQDNFKVFEQRLRDFLEHRLIREPKSDQDFADLDQQIKAMKQARESVKGAKAQMLAQVEPVDRANKTADMLDTLLQQNLSMAERLLKDEKERRRGEIVAGGTAALKAHVDGLNQRLGKPYMPAIPADFGGCVKGLKSLASMEDKVTGELARCKIAANDIAGRIHDNLTILREQAKDHAFLFADTAAIVLKEPDHLQALVRDRIGTHKAEQERKEAETRERIRQEEVARLEREQAAREAEARQAAQAATPAPTPQPAPIASPALSSPAANVVPLGTRAPAPVESTATIRLGQINERFQRLHVTAEDLAALGFKPAGKDRSAVLYREADFIRICHALIDHLHAVAQQLQAA